MQGTMSLIEGYSNLVMNELGARLLPGFQELEEAYRRRSSNKGMFDQLVWKFTGLDLKLQQYRRGEAFARAVYDAYGMEALNLAWKGPEQMPTLDELAKPEEWYRRVTG
jgi:putative hydrolase